MSERKLGFDSETNMEEQKFDKDINVRSKDDTEIDVGMIEKTLEIDKTVDVWLLKGSIWERYNLQKILDIIHRLQDENYELKEDNEQWEALYHIGEERKYRKMFVEEWKKEYQKELDKQGEGVIAGSPDFDYVYQRYFEQKTEYLVKINLLGGEVWHNIKLETSRFKTAEGMGLKMIDKIQAVEFSISEGNYLINNFLWL